ncbi:MAG: AAA family ATPase, partial [Bacteroidota bacterium]
SINIDKKVEEYFSAISNKKEEIENFIKSCQSKINNIQSQENFDFQLLTRTLEIIETSIIKINNIRNNELSELREKQNKLAILVKGAIGLEIIKSTLIKEKLNEVKTKEDELRAKLDNNQKKRQEILELKQQKSLTKDFADFVSQILKDINISLVVTLDTDNRNYIIKSAHENVILTIKDISEGEKNLLALLFFYYELFADNKQQRLKPEIELIIVDDPISSMDDSNRFYILELMKNLLELQNQQIFIMTHSWDDICNLSYGKKSWENNQPFATFEIRKVDGRSELFKLKNIEKPYKYLFREIYEFSQKREDDIKTDCQIYHYPNVMRRVFEEWYSFKIGKDLNLTSSQQDRITNELKITDDREKMKLGILLKVCNILSHSINNSKNPQEIHQSAKYLMKLIENNDKLHFDNMKS